MKMNVVVTLMKYVYDHILRDILVKAIDNPDTDWDEYIIMVCDRIFDYGG